MKKTILFVSLVIVSAFIFTACSDGKVKEDMSKYTTDCEKSCAKTKDGCVKYSEKENQFKTCDTNLEKCLNACKEKK